MKEYLDLAYLGKNQWWRWLVGTVTILLCWQGLGALPSVALILWVMLDNDPASGVSPAGMFTGAGVTLPFVTLMLASWAFMGGLFVAVRFVHQRKFMTLVTPRRRLDLKRLGQAFGAWFVLAGMVALVESWLHPARYALTLDWGHFLTFAPLALVMIPVQTSAEELLFRGYLLQGLGLRIRKTWILCLISGVVFMLPHLLNPEARLNFGVMGLYYFAFGAALAYLTLRDGRLELALGMHAANNLFTALVANGVVTVLPTPSIFTIMEMDVVYSTVASLAAMGIFILFFSKRRAGRGDSLADAAEAPDGQQGKEERIAEEGGGRQ